MNWQGSASSTMAFDAFISYSNKDKITADATCAVLESAGIRCWIAPRDVRTGSECGAAIIEAIEHCHVMVLVFSSSANESRQIHREIERAVVKGVPILPVRIEEVTPTKSMEYFLGAIHWMDALNPPLEQHLQKLAETIKAMLKIDAGVGGTSAADEARAAFIPKNAAEMASPRAETTGRSAAATVVSVPKYARPNWRLPAILAVASIVLLAGGVGVYRLLLSAPASTSGSTLSPGYRASWDATEGVCFDWRGTWDLNPTGPGSWSGKINYRNNRGSCGAGSGATFIALVTVQITGGTWSAQRSRSSDGNDCTYGGTVQGNQLVGQYRCRGGGPFGIVINMR